MWQGGYRTQVGQNSAPSRPGRDDSAPPRCYQESPEDTLAHLFISHSTRDGGAIAQQLAASLEAAGHRCWIAPRDVKPGMPYPGQIVSAIESCSGLVLIVTPAANESPDVLQEVQLANTARKVIAPVVVNATAPGPDMRYYIGVRHQIPWSDARATTVELLRSFPAAQQPAAPVKTGKSLSEALRDASEKPARAWAPSMPSAEPGSSASDRFDVFMLTTGPSKINVIKVIREYTGWGLAETKMIVEGFPPVRVGHGVPRDRAEALVKDLVDQGATMMPLAPFKG
jgi:ribosomal protein L7/L12